MEDSLSKYTYGSELFSMQMINILGEFSNESLLAPDMLEDTSGFTCPNLTEDNYFAKLKSFQRFFIPLVYLLVFLVGMLGNGLVLLIVLIHNRSRSTTENFLLHLAVADLLMLFTFPFAVTESVAGWVFGDFLCRVVGVIHRINFLCSSLLLGCISVDRYLAVIHAVHAFRTRGVMTVHISCCVVWAFCFLLSLPNLFFLGIQKHDNLTTCSYGQSHFPSNGWWQAGRFLNHVVGFIFPLLLMTFCYAHIVAALRQSPRREKKRAVRVAIVITVVFFLCWIPYNIAVFLDTLDQLGTIQSCVLREQLPVAFTVTEFLGYVHCCLNPVLYAFMGEKFRNEALRVICSKGKLIQQAQVSRKSSATDSEMGTVMSSI